jgi:hypothetical protein
MLDMCKEILYDKKNVCANVFLVLLNNFTLEKGEAHW